MHIPDGFLPPSLCLSGYGITGFLTWYSLRQINREQNTQENIPKASLLTAAFFVSSLIHIPIPPTSIHLVLNGIMGVVLGYYAFPAILIGLFFQAVMFQHGGLSTLGLNAIMMGVPALFAYHLFQLRKYLGDTVKIRTILAFFAGTSALFMSALIFTCIVVSNIPAELDAQTETKMLYLAMISYSIQAIIEGFFTVMLVSFFERVKPELLVNK